MRGLCICCFYTYYERSFAKLTKQCNENDDDDGDHYAKARFPLPELTARVNGPS